MYSAWEAILAYSSRSLNFATRFFSMEACSESSWLAAALSSAVAELVCTTLEIWSTPNVTCSMAPACSSAAFAISSTLVEAERTWSTTCTRDSAVELASLVPLVTALTEFSISSAVF